MAKLPLPPRAMVRTINRWQDTNEVVLALDVDGETLRFTLDDAGLRFLAEQAPVQRWLKAMPGVTVHCPHPVLTNDHSEISSGIANLPGKLFPVLGLRQTHQNSIERRPGLAKPGSALCFEIISFAIFNLNSRDVFPHVVAASQGSG